VFNSLDISSSALTAQRTRLDVIAGNIANAFSTRQEDGTIEPYRRRFVSLSAGDGAGGSGVHVDSVERDASEFRLKYDDGHPDRIREGPLANYVRYPNVNVAMEYVDAIEASRAYEANVSMLNLSRTMLQQSIRLLA
jgi:flagellar basal-body rod protein FlgC